MLEPATISHIKTFVINELRLAWESKGHTLTGKLIDDLEFILSDNQIDVMMYDYGIIQDVGVKAANVPYSGRGGGGVSKYIEGLMRYVAMRMGIAEGTKENKGIAFAIANTHKKTGIRIQ